MYDILPCAPILRAPLSLISTDGVYSMYLQMYQAMYMYMYIQPAALSRPPCSPIIKTRQDSSCILTVS